MLDKVEGNLLFDFYGSLLTEHQREVLDDYFNDDLSMSELADEYEVSKSAISDLIKRCLNQLEEYENKLQGINVGKYAWLGDPSELTSNNADYEVAAVVTQKAKDEYIAEVTVSWDMASKKKQLVLGRSIYARNAI